MLSCWELPDSKAIKMLNILQQKNFHYCISINFALRKETQYMHIMCELKSLQFSMIVKFHHFCFFFTLENCQPSWNCQYANHIRDAPYLRSLHHRRHSNHRHSDRRLCSAMRSRGGWQWWAANEQAGNEDKGQRSSVRGKKWQVIRCKVWGGECGEVECRDKVSYSLCKTMNL